MMCEETGGRSNRRMQFPALKLRMPPAGVVIWNAILVMILTLGFLPVGSAARSSGPTFNKNVAPILFNHCVQCHRPGEIAYRLPFVSYDTVKPWAESIKQQVLTREMPPWPADPNRSVKFRNDARLSKHDIDTLVAWVNAGAPKGNDADLPPLPKSEDGWMHPQGLKPDLVLSLPSPVHVPAEGELPYVRVLVKVPLSDDRWIVASQTRPGNPAVVHHMAITEISLAPGMTPTELDQLEGVTRKMGFQNTMFGAQPAVTDPSNPRVFDMLGMYTPGTTFESYPEGTAKLLKGGENVYLSFNVHYGTTGEPETDQSAIALWFQSGPPRHQLFRVPGAGETIIANGKEILTDSPGTKAEGTHVAIPPIPPHADNYEVTGVTGYTEPVTIYQFQPHAHNHGKDFTYSVVFPDGREQTVLTIPKYDHRWQMAYELETPLKLPAGSKLVVTAHYDNSQMNMSGMKMDNPGSEKEVYFRDMNSTSDEMFTPFIQYTIDSEDLPMPQPHQQDKKTNIPQRQERLEVVEVVGCLEPNPPGKWMLTSAADPVVSATQSTSSVALKTAQTTPLGSRRYQLLGASIFNPSSHLGEKVAVKGILIKDSEENRVNVTSLQMLATACSK